MYETCRMLLIQFSAYPAASLSTWWNKQEMCLSGSSSLRTCLCTCCILPSEMALFKHVNNTPMKVTISWIWVWISDLYFHIRWCSTKLYFVSSEYHSHSLHNKATIHQVTSMPPISKNVLFAGHSHILSTGSDDPTLWSSIQVPASEGSSVGYQWLASGYDLEIGHFY